DTVYSADRDEWLGLIDVLKRYRKQRPLDGVVLTVSTGSLLSMQTTAEVQQQARILRSRLNDLISGLGTKFPVYLVFTNIDAVQGFDEFFGLLEAEEREGVWGMMIPLAQKDRAHTLFDVEYAQLIESLLTRRLQRINLSGTSGVNGASKEHLSVFDFPLQLNSARQKFGAFTNALFSPNPFSEQPLLRGIYFTSSASRGNVSGTGRLKRQVEVGAAAEVRIRYRGFFTEGFFKQVLRSDRHVAAAMQANYVQPGRLRRLAIAAASCGALSLVLLIGMLVSYFNNQRLIGEAGRAGADLLRHFKPAAAGGAARLTETEAEDLGKLQDVLLKLDDYDRSWVGPLSHRFGLYQGKKIRPRLREIYFDFLTQRLLDPSLADVSRDIYQQSPAPSAIAGPSSPRAASAVSQQEQVDAAEQSYYDRLKAYLMVERQERVEPVFLQQQLASYWKEGQAAAEMRHLYYYAEQASINADEDQSVPRPQAG
ncbi:MAG: hypothetical protein J2P31_21200, partial [Blastocatellia bacterium]|nr:hypothetical protein [Blastocatellia bacterium]